MRLILNSTKVDFIFRQRLNLYSTKVDYIFRQRSTKACSAITHKSKQTKKYKIQSYSTYFQIVNIRTSYGSLLTDLLAINRNLQNYLYKNVAIALDVDFRITGVFDKYRKTSTTCSLVSIVFKLVVSL